ncbi:hypothetical protein [Romboutsia lituseburensis]|uniref:hypothetical protein n=1 Tax=Romboutsia lituseburensis TaxID=1537 RepID=UPI00215B5E3C|nr:hypothetical protein [Romboutsia lituseburensis]MCR8744364.1 hypothetical protein [Romboutsia lituseburensis]
MKNTIHGFNQRKALELELDLKQLIILRWFVDYKDTGKMNSKMFDDDKYYWIKYEGIIDALPILKTTSHDTIYRYLKKMSKVGVLKHRTLKQGGIWSYFTLGDRYKELIDDSYMVGKKSDSIGNESEGNGKKSDSVGKKSEGNGKKVGTKKQPIINTSIINTTTGEEDVVVEDVNRYRAMIEVKKAFNELVENDIKKVVDSLQSTTGTYDIDYLKSKLEITKNNSHIKNITGFLIKAIKENYNIKSLSNNNTQHTTKPTKFHNFDETFTQYETEELDEIILKSQRAKFG